MIASDGHSIQHAVAPIANPARLYCHQPGKGGTILFLVHMDEANNYIPEFTSDDIPIHAFHHMRLDQLTGFNQLEEFARIYVQKVLNIQPDGPYILAGYSIGGLIAFEMASQLKAMGKDVARLILLDTKSSTLHGRRQYHNRQFKWNESKIVKFIRKISKYTIVRMYRTLNKPVPRSLMPFFLMERYRKARKAYTVKPYEGRVLLIRSTRNNFKDKALGWKAHLTGSFEIAEIDTDHHHITIPPAVEEVARLLEQEYRRLSREQ